MTPHTVQKRMTKRTYKLRGTLVGVDLVHHVIVIQPSEHDGKRVRRLSVMADSEILAGDERKTLADLVVGEWVTAQFVKQEDHRELKRLHIPRGMASSPFHQSEGGSAVPTVGSDPLPKAS